MGVDLALFLAEPATALADQSGLTQMADRLTLLRLELLEHTPVEVTDDRAQALLPTEISLADLDHVTCAGRLAGEDRPFDVLADDLQLGRIDRFGEHGLATLLLGPEEGEDRRCRALAVGEPLGTQAGIIQLGWFTDRGECLAG